MTYDEFFRKATDHEPYPYQSRLVSEPWPDLLQIPTGLGKTAAMILAWLYRRRIMGDLKTPRRLVYCLPMRVLVEQTSNCAETWLRKLDLLAEDAPEEHPIQKVAVHRLMGGEVEIDWDRWPDREQILIGTQDMLLSRALNRGYAMSRFRWPIQFGLLMNDCLWVMDEVQLMGNGLATTTQLDGFREKFGTVIPSRSLWMSATIRSDWLGTVDFKNRADALITLGIDDSDAVHPGVKTRFEASKPIENGGIEASNDGKAEAQLLLEGHRKGTRSLCVVNTVKRAQALFEALRKCKPAAKLVLLHSQFRPPERRSQLADLLAEPEGPGTIAVSTQVVEAGVDVSARLLITDLAPWASLVQRFGRCNRNGEIDDAKVVWISPPHLKEEKKLAPAPYTAEDLEKAAIRLGALTDVGSQNLPLFKDELQFNHVIRRKDFVDLFDTTPDLNGADIDVSRYIREADEHHVQVFWREVPETGPADEEPLPDREELCNAPIGDLTKLPSPAWKRDFAGKTWEKVRGRRIFPGLVLMLRPEDGLYDERLGWTGRSGRVKPVLAIPADPSSGREDPLSENRSWQTISAHTDSLVTEVKELLGSLSILSEVWAKDFLVAARHHDAGKAHEIFQSAFPDDKPEGFWAKSSVKMKPYSRPGFRHELVSALAVLNGGHSDLAAYLVAAHHGKIRLSIRSLPGEKPPPGEPDRLFARGVWDGDRLPAADLGGGVIFPETILRLSYMVLGEDNETGPSWLARMLALRDSPELGPLRLAFLEALFRVADWRASGRESGEKPYQTTKKSACNRMSPSANQALSPRRS